MISEGFRRLFPTPEVKPQLLRIIFIPGTLFLALCLLISPAAWAEGGSLQGKLLLGGGYLEHPIGLAYENDAGYLTQALNLAALFDQDQDRFKLGYEGNATQFGNDTQLGSMRHGLGVEWFRTLPGNDGGRPGQISAGVQVAWRSYQEFFSMYDYGELYSYLSFRKYLGVRTLLKGYGAIKIRDYGEILGESFREPHGKLEIQRFFESRTTLGLAVRFGAKFYFGVAASEVWETLNLPSTSQLSTRLNFSQGITDRFGARGWLDYRVNFDDYPHYYSATEEIFDSPLLDRYAREGLDAFGALKLLVPWQTWLEGGVSYGDHDFGNLLFPSDEAGVGPGEGQVRSDTFQDYYLSPTRVLSGALGRPKLVVTGGWLDRESSLSRYTFSGAHYSATMTWSW